ncbi:MAG: class I SAM-dependent methyltransferase [Alphaproteobacteria bacterium]|nr:class I SAM-dependent methyltransferase [Alphaproteobacteria bacterium]MBV8336123.1 class I SAM-dependent methyltransferase [Alphaproteobacteria bacterium]
MKVIGSLRRNSRSADSAAESLRALVAGCANQSDLLNRKFDQIIAGLDNQSDLLNRKFDRLIEGVAAGNRVRNDYAANTPTPSLAAASGTPVNGTMQHSPLLVAERTYNTAHPDYDARIVRNYPGFFLNLARPSDNAAFLALSRFAEGDQVPEHVWDAVLGETFVEAASVPEAAQVFARRSYVERYVSELGRRHHAQYAPGWVNFEDALFLYWLVRRLKPRTIVQTGVCNGLSTAFMMLGLAKNGPDGILRAIDLPSVFDAGNPFWTIKGKVYGFVIPEGKTSGWLVPEGYQDRLEIWTGNARDLLPRLVDEVDSIDLFYHDSDHSYDHMIFEFRQAKRKISRGGLVVADDVAWNASLWDFADECGVPSYNFKGSVGVAFF